MAFDKQKFREARAVAAKARREILKAYKHNPNITGAGFGPKVTHDAPTDEPALVVTVVRKVDKRNLAASEALPDKVRVDGEEIVVDVHEIGFLQAFDLIGPPPTPPIVSRVRPLELGISAGHYQVTAGTLGAVVIDRYDGKRCILSNNHVFANTSTTTGPSNAAVDDPILQPGVHDGGKSDTDTVARLKRWVPIDLDNTGTGRGNNVDAAIASPTTKEKNRVYSGCIDIATSSHRAIGLLFAGSGFATVLNPFELVMSELRIDLPGGADVVRNVDESVLRLAVEKVGRTTGYTTGNIWAIDQTQRVGYGGNRVATFQNCILTTPGFSQGGDSGSLVYMGGTGGGVPWDGSCPTLRNMESVLNIPLASETERAKLARDEVLRPTQTGNYLVDLFYANEDRLNDRLDALNEQNVNDLQPVAQALYMRYAGPVALAIADPTGDETQITDQHLADAQAALEAAKGSITESEAKAAQSMIDIGSEAVGATVARAIALLDTDDVHQRVVAALREVPTITQP